jgi:hypothetical protein
MGKYLDIDSGLIYKLIQEPPNKKRSYQATKDQGITVNNKQTHPAFDRPTKPINMKTYLYFPLVIVCLMLLSNCKKDKSPVEIPEQRTASQYFPPLKTGNFWVYKVTFESGPYPNYTLTTEYDTVKVLRDTLIGGRRYFEITNGAIQGLGHGLYADSAGWIITYNEGLFPLTAIANDTVWQDTMGAILYGVYKTGNTDTTISVPVGSFACTEMIGDIYYLYDSPPIPNTNPRKTFTYFCKNVGVTKALTWAASGPGNVVSELHSYHIQP